jgi:hypothetical protein
MPMDGPVARRRKIGPTRACLSYPTLGSIEEPLTRAVVLK